MFHRHLHFYRAALCLSLALLGCTVRGAAQEVKNASGDMISFTSTGAWRSATLGGHALKLTPDMPLLWVCDVERGDRYFPLTGSVRPQNGALQMTLASTELALQATLTVAADKAAFRYHLQLHDSSGHDRGLLVRMGVPVDATGWKWWRDIQTSATIESGKTYEDVQPLRAFAALPEWKDKPALRMGFNTLNFCSVITAPVTTAPVATAPVITESVATESVAVTSGTAPVGLCFAVPLDQPRIFRTGYDAAQKLLGITYDVALCKETRVPFTADFEFEMFGCDARWGMRDALDKYYRRHPQFFEKVVRDEGMWIAFTRLHEIDNANEFRIGFQEGAADAAYDDKINVDSLSYYTHAGMYADVPDHKRGIDPTPSLERRIAATEATFKRETKRDGVYAEVGTYDAAGKLAAEPGSVYGDVLAQFCLEPELFYGKWLIDRIDPFFADFRQRGGELDGFYYDGLTQGINYRRDHFAVAEYPPAWDPIAKKPYLFNYFSSVEWAKHVAQKLHSQGKITMMNGAMAANPFCAPYLDIMGAETGLNISRADFNFVKTITHHKPFATLMKANYAHVGSAEMELFMKRCLAYGVFPGYFDWPPSGLGPGGTYWDHPEYYERDRPLFRKYLPLVQTIAQAGWEPLTLARADSPLLQVERYGSAAQGHVYFAVLNDSNEARRATIRLDAQALKLPKNFVVVDEVAGRPLAVDRTAATAKIAVDLPAEGVALLHVATKQAVIAHHIAEIRKIEALRLQQSRADSGRPTRPMFWKTTEAGVQRDAGAPPDEDAPHDGAPPNDGAPANAGAPHDNEALVLYNDDDNRSTNANQWVMLFQTAAKPLTVRARYKTAGIVGEKNDAFSLHAVVCYVDNQFTTYDPHTLQLEPNSPDWRTVEWKIEPKRPVRSVQLFLRLNKRRGKVWFDDISLRSADKPTIEAVVDGGFAHWYEAADSQLRFKVKLVPKAIDELENALGATPSATHKSTSLKSTALQQPPPRPRAVLPLLAGALFSTRDSLDSIKATSNGNRLRREKRDLAEIEKHLNLCAQLESDVRGLKIQAPGRATAGSTIGVAIKVESAAKTPARAAYSLRTTTAEGMAAGTAKVTPSATVSPAVGTRLYRVSIPKSARPGSTITLNARATVRLDANTTLPLHAAHTVTIVPGAEASVALQGVEPDGLQSVEVRLVNNGEQATEFLVDAVLPPDWQLRGVEGVGMPLETLRAPVRAHRTSPLLLTLKPPHDAAPGRHQVVFKVRGGGQTFALPLEINHIPASANLLKNGGFEAGSLEQSTSWDKWNAGYHVDETVKHSGRRSLRLQTVDPTQSASASQSVKLNQQVATPLIVRGWSLARNVSGEPDSGYSLYVDIYYADGTKLYGQGVHFKTGSHDWQFGEASIEVTKPVASLSFYAMLRGKTGMAYFDDLFIGPDPSRTGNLARAARVLCDSFYTDYTAAPLNDGVTLQTAQMHWTAAAWASADTPAPHWVELQWDRPQKIERAKIYWSLDSGITHTSRRVEVQVPDGDNWKTVQVVNSDKATEQSEITFPTVTTQKLRFLQPPGAGSPERPQLMWVREIEVF